MKTKILKTERRNKRPAFYRKRRVMKKQRVANNSNSVPAICEKAVTRQGDEHIEEGRIHAAVAQAYEPGGDK